MRRMSVRDGDPRPKVAAAGRIVLLTSGTTGAPKGVPRHPKIRLALGIGASILDRTGLRIGSRISVPVPMFHGLGFGMLVLTLGLGGTVLTLRRFDAEAMLAQASEHRAEALTVVPVMLARILDLTDDVRERNPLPSLRVVISSGARLYPSLATRFTRRLRRRHLQRLRLIGGRDRSPRNANRPSGSTGDGGQTRCRLRGPHSRRPRRTRRTGGHRASFRRRRPDFRRLYERDTKGVIDDMMDTGDMGYLDRAGRLFIVGRDDDMIVSGGENANRVRSRTPSPNFRESPTTR